MYTKFTKQHCDTFQRCRAHGQLKSIKIMFLLFFGHSQVFSPLVLNCFLCTHGFWSIPYWKEFKCPLLCSVFQLKSVVFLRFPLLFHLKTMFSLCFCLFTNWKTCVPCVFIGFSIENVCFPKAFICFSIEKNWFSVGSHRFFNWIVDSP